MIDTEIFEKRVGTVIKDKWTLERLLGVGGMAAVYVAAHKIGRREAIKILHPEIARSRDLRTRFEREAEAVNRFKHPGAVEIRDIDVTEDGAPFLVMELLEGESLAERARRQDGIAVDELLRLSDELLDVLAAAHAQGIVHRDIKLDNLFVLSDGRLKVLDFGIARIKSGAKHTMQTRTGATLGTVPYMPPEQVKGLEIDHRADLFAVGATMFRLVARRRIHEAKSESEMLVKMATQPAPKLLDVAPHASPGLGLVVDRALMFERDDRYPDALTMQGDVRALRRLEPPPYATSAASRPGPVASAAHVRPASAASASSAAGAFVDAPTVTGAPLPEAPAGREGTQAAGARPFASTAISAQSPAAPQTTQKGTIAMAAMAAPVMAFPAPAPSVRGGYGMHGPASVAGPVAGSVAGSAPASLRSASQVAPLAHSVPEGAPLAAMGPVAAAPAPMGGARPFSSTLSSAGSHPGHVPHTLQPQTLQPQTMAGPASVRAHAGPLSSTLPAGTSAHGAQAMPVAPLGAPSAFTTTGTHAVIAAPPARSRGGAGLAIAAALGLVVLLGGGLAAYLLLGGSDEGGSLAPASDAEAAEAAAPASAPTPAASAEGAAPGALTGAPGASGPRAGSVEGAGVSRPDAKPKEGAEPAGAAAIATGSPAPRAPGLGAADFPRPGSAAGEAASPAVPQPSAAGAVQGTPGAAPAGAAAPSGAPNPSVAAPSAPAPTPAIRPGKSGSAPGQAKKDKR